MPLDKILLAIKTKPVHINTIEKLFTKMNNTIIGRYKGGLCSLNMMHYAVIYYRLVCDVITLMMHALSKQLHQAPVLGEDADMIYLHSCVLNTKFVLNSTFSASFTAECGLRPIHFPQFFGGEALVYVTG